MIYISDENCINTKKKYELSKTTKNQRLMKSPFISGGVLFDRVQELIRVDHCEGSNYNDRC